MAKVEDKNAVGPIVGCLSHSISLIPLFKLAYALEPMGRLEAYC